MKRTREQRYAEQLITEALTFAYNLNQYGLDVVHAAGCHQNRPKAGCAGCRRYAKIQALKLPAWERVQRRVRAAREYSTLWDGRGDRMLSYRKRYQILARDGFRCTVCGAGAKHDVVLHVDHIVPWTKGGSNDDANLITLCMPCNVGKYNDLPAGIAGRELYRQPEPVAAQPTPKRRRPTLAERRAAELQRLAAWQEAA